jgi:isoprenylcysteine carboxyl methyltransferase (ICMT) family protein YpbQ
VFTIFNAAVLAVRIRAENAALAEAQRRHDPVSPGGKPA